MVDDQTSYPTIDDGLKKCDAPIHRLSFDVLSQIFLECLPDFPSLPSVLSDEAPVLLGRICSHWRAVALNTHQLWPGISLGSGSSRADYRKDILAAAEWKTRAGACLLSYCLSRRTPDGILDFILRHCGQWRHIEVNLKMDGWNRVYGAISQGRVPHLRYLDIQILNPSFHTREPFEFRNDVQIDIPFPGVPQLQSLLTRVNVKLHFSGMKSPSLRMLIFDYQTLSLDDCWTCLRYCPNLEHFSAICDEGDPFTFSPDIIEAKALKHFQLTIEAAGFDCFLDVIHAPSLEILTVNFYHHNLPRLWRFLEISGAHLLGMNIKAPMTGDQIIECLPYTPALTSLELRNALLNDAIIEALTLGPRQAISHYNLCPKLQRIVLVETSLMSLDIMKTMILSRWGGVGETVMLSNGGPDSNWEKKPSQHLTRQPRFRR
ncbi:hypothetical protein BD410DRAFT_635581 [Rickenella mellea]|uniref:F-box domain-containing protein n=1 Tax=Rickenella mellea TaxID=50990 RepID=A0A4Y7QEM6_9AGAM|nr:hypothetical protein BD410DRAFT_635581 [Rickenella mellea]